MSRMKYAGLDLGKIEAVFNKLGGMEGAEAFLRDELVIVKRPATDLLEFAGVANIAATTTKFVATKKFKLKKDRRGTFSSIGGNFKSLFGDKVENPMGEKTIRYAKLKKSSGDLAIVAELGGEEKAETSLTEVFSLISKQAKGETGILLTNCGPSTPNIFYVRDNAGVLRVVGVSWDDGNWVLSAKGFDSPDVWYGGCRVFARI